MQYGLIGEHLGHSFSKDIHNLIGDYQYELREIEPEKLDDFMKEKDFKAINVTIPYKQSVIPYLDKIDSAAEMIGAVNTIVNKDGILYGYNTDFYGMKSLIEKIGLEVKDKNVLILGTGGTSKTAKALVQSLGAKTVFKVSRHADDEEGLISYDQALKKDQTNIIINTTPCGMFPKADCQPIELDSFSKLEGVIDAIYNPNCSNLILSAREKGLKAEGGLYMLVMQAVKAAEFFFDRKIDRLKADQIFNIILGRKENIVLVGMPACGKTSVGNQISKLLGKEIIDTDAQIVKKEGRAISEIFASEGEAYFRQLESQVIAEISQRTGIIISTGGGAVLNPLNVHNLKQNGKIYFIDRPLEQLMPTADRPTANDPEKIKNLFKVRHPIYEACADRILEGGIGTYKIAHQIIKLAGLEQDIKEDKAVILPSKAQGIINAPPSKSIAHRALILSALSQGKSRIGNIDYSQDILATLDCLETLGVKIEKENSESLDYGDTLTVYGCGRPEIKENAVFNCRESGSTLRFFLPMAFLFGNKSVFTGSQVLMSRPLSVYEKICAENNIVFERKDGKIFIDARESRLKDKLPFNFNVDGNISSQFITGLLFILPFMEKGSSIKINPPVESKPYIELTLAAMKDFGINSEISEDFTLIKVSGSYRAFDSEIYEIEGDCSNAAFLEAFNCLGGNVKVGMINEKTVQGDFAYRKFFKMLEKSKAKIDISDCPDLGPVLFVIAACQHGGIFTGTRRLAMKESDRGKIMCKELSRFGIKSHQTENSIEIFASKIHAPKDLLSGHNDHRIVMALTTMLTITGGQVDDAHAVSKSYPKYFQVIKKLGIKAETQIDDRNLLKN
ncbi:MAG: hypothetical protein K5839_03550 [Treponemataceae bacterium]|nr:hypothetical protein [Treponemataceae bacterium]